MQAFYSDHFVLPLPDGHKFPMAKYSGLRERILAEGIVRPDDLHEAPAAAWDDLRLVHEAAYVDAVASGTLPREAQRRIGFPWSPQMVERARRSVGATIAAARVALDEGVAANLAGVLPSYRAMACSYSELVKLVRRRFAQSVSPHQSHRRVL